MIKNVPNCIFYLHEFSNIFNQRLPIFLVRNYDFWKLTHAWGPTISGYAATCRAWIGWLGRHCHCARALKAPSWQRRTRVRAPLPVTSSALHHALVGSSRHRPSPHLCLLPCCWPPHSFISPSLAPLLPRVQVMELGQSRAPPHSSFSAASPLGRDSPSASKVTTPPPLPRCAAFSSSARAALHAGLLSQSCSGPRTPDMNTLFTPWWF
jgi:hypothetical protein